MATATQNPSTVGAPPGARQRFLSSGTPPQGVRDVVVESWIRATQSGLDPTGLKSAHGAPATDPRILQCVDLVVTRYLAHLGGEPISVIFASPAGQVLRQFCTDRELTRTLERVYLEPGFHYDEGTVGTNGIGTALQCDRPTLIVGEEHYNESLTVFACAGAPVHHPVSRAIAGIVDLTCAAARGNGLLLTYARTIAEEIELELLRQVGAKELALLRDYLAACRHATGPIVALNSDLMMMNHHAQQLLPSPDRAALLAQTSDVSGVDKPSTFVTDLPSGRVARMDYRPIFWGDELAGAVVRVSLQAGSSGRAGQAAPTPQRLPGLAGTSPGWLRACASVRQAMASQQWLIVDGEHGVGKFSLVKSTHYAETPERHFRMLDAANAGESPDAWLEVVQAEFDGPPGTLVLRHLDLLPESLLGPLSEVLMQNAARSRAGEAHWVVATRDQEAANAEVAAQLVPIFDATVTVEPLRHRPEDIRAMVPVILRGLTGSEELQLSSRAVNQLQRHPWPGNTTQLQQVLRKLVSTKRRGLVDLQDLPAECMAVGRRTLSPLESLERDAIVTALRDHRGNKASAAEHLGMSRATIYRKIREYSIPIDL